MTDEDAGRSKGQLIADKFRWLVQVAGDSRLPPSATPIAVFIAAEFINSKTGEAYPAMATLAARIGRSETQTREAIKSLVERKHLELSPSRGGARQTNRYKMALKPLGNPQGFKTEKPLGNSSETPRKPGENPSGIREKPLGNPEGIPLKNSIEEPFDESASGGWREAGRPSAGQRRSSSTESTIQEPRRRALSSAPSLRVGDEFDHEELGKLEVRKITTEHVVAAQVKEPYERYILAADTADFASAAYQLEAMA